MKDFKAIRLVFENLETVQFDIEDVPELTINNIQRSIMRTRNSVNVDKFTAKDVMIQVYNRAKYHPEVYIGMNDKEGSVFERIVKYDDIFSISVLYTDDSSEIFFVDWDGGDLGVLGASNNNQTSSIGRNGDLFIVISENHNVKRHFGEYLFPNLATNKK